MYCFAKWILASSITLAISCGGSAKTSSIPTPREAEPPSDANQAAAPTAFPKEDFRKKQPNAGLPRPFQIPAPKRFSLPMGIEVLLVEKHTLPLVSVRITFDGGRGQDPKRKSGLASVCMALLTEGTRDLPKEAFEEALADVASSISSSVGADEHSISMHSISKHFDATFALFRDVITRPGVRRVDFKRIISRQLEALKQAKGAARSIAHRLSRGLMYGPAHPLGRLADEKSLGRIRLSDCRRYYRRYIKPKRARLYVVGDITENQIREAFATKAIQKWRGRNRRIRAFPGPEPRAGRIFFVHVPGSAQSYIRLLHAGPQRTGDDYFVNTMMAAVLAGGFSGRVNMNLREDKGYSYGAGGGFYYLRGFGEFAMGASVRSDSTRESLLELYREFADLHAGIRPAQVTELQREKQGAILSLPSKFATARKTLARYSDLVYFGLPLDYYNSIIQKYQGVTIEQVNASAKTQLKPDSLKILVVGDGDAKMIHRVDRKDVPLVNQKGEPITLRESLRAFVSNKKFDANSLVFLDPDGKVLAN